jgi:hypothetical protein
MLVCAAVALGCARPSIHTPAPTTPHGNAPPSTTILVARLVVPRETFAVGTVPAIQASFQAGDLRFREMDAQLRELLQGLGAQILEERDVGGTPPGSGTYVLRLEVLSYAENTSFASAERALCIIFGSLTAGLGYLPCVGIHDTTTHTLELEVRLYDAAGASLERVERNGELEVVVDTSERRPVFRRTYRVELQSSVSAWSGPPSGPEGEQFVRDQGRRLGHVAFGAVAGDLVRGLSVRQEAVPPAPAPVVVDADPQAPEPQ